MNGIDLTGRVALVTGAESGIGRATAVAFARADASVIGAGLDESSGAETVRLVEGERSDGTFFRADVSKGDQVENLVKLVVESFGQLDFAFNNAGIAGKVARPPISRKSHGEWCSTSI